MKECSGTEEANRFLQHHFFHYTTKLCKMEASSSLWPPWPRSPPWRRRGEDLDGPRQPSGYDWCSAKSTSSRTLIAKASSSRKSPRISSNATDSHVNSEFPHQSSPLSGKRNYSFCNLLYPHSSHLKGRLKSDKWTSLAFAVIFLILYCHVNPVSSSGKNRI